MAAPSLILRGSVAGVTLDGVGSSPYLKPSSAERICSSAHSRSRSPESHMADDPRLFYDRHIFMCNNVRPDGHPRGCCMARAEAAGGFDKLRGYAREKARQLGIQNVRFNAAGCLDRCEFGPNMVIYPEGTWYRFESQSDIDEILETHFKNGGRVARLMLQTANVAQ